MVSGNNGGSSDRGTTVVLCFCALTHSYLIFSVLPYAGYFALFLLEKNNTATNNNNGDDDGAIRGRLTMDSIGIYAGLLGSAFTSGRLLSLVPWKAA